jgi:hypothetical protein
MSFGGGFGGFGSNNNNNNQQSTFGGGGGFGANNNPSSGMYMFSSVIFTTLEPRATASEPRAPPFGATSLTQLLRHQASVPIRTPAASSGTLARPCSAEITPVRALHLEVEVRRSFARRNRVILVTFLGRISSISRACYNQLLSILTAGAICLAPLRVDVVIPSVFHWIIDFICHAFLFRC